MILCHFVYTVTTREKKNVGLEKAKPNILLMVGSFNHVHHTKEVPLVDKFKPTCR